MPVLETKEWKRKKKVVPEELYHKNPIVDWLRDFDFLDSLKSGIPLSLEGLVQRQGQL